MSPNKLIVPYLHRVCRHLLWQPYRARVQRELTDHILSRAEDCAAAAVSHRSRLCVRCCAHSVTRWM